MKLDYALDLVGSDVTRTAQRLICVTEIYGVESARIEGTKMIIKTKTPIGRHHAMFLGVECL